MGINYQSDNRRVALIKSLHTKNRFYALVDPSRGIKNADTVADIPDDLQLGIAYPCLEDGLNDFAVIRTTFETLDYFPEDDPVRDEMMEIIHDARSNLLRRLNELRDKIHANKAHFLGTDYNEFKGYALDMAHRGMLRRNLDSMMKLNVFTSVAEAEGESDAHNVLYHYEFHQSTNKEAAAQLSAREFIVTLFNDLIACVVDDTNYRGKYSFDKHVFQKFIAVMFINYATTDPMFYGINKQDYAVSSDRSMDETPLYIAIARELREIEGGGGGGSVPPMPLPAAPPYRPPAPPPTTVAAPEESEPDFSLALELPGSERSAGTQTPSGRLTLEQAAELLPRELIHEEVLLGPISSLCSAAQVLMRKSDPETQKFAQVILADAAKVVEELKRLGLISPIVNNPGSPS